MDSIRITKMGKGTSEDAVSQIDNLQKFAGRMSLEPITAVMDALGDPQRTFPAIHIAGTNGKGSTATMIAAILEEAGYRVGVYTSPHLTDFRERIRVNGEPISLDRIRSYYIEVAAAAEETDLTFFECITALAFMHFAREDVDIAVIETGLGGRLDATNIIDPELAVITNVARDPTNYLGETPEQVAYENAGIITEGTPVVSGVEGDPADVVEAVAEQRAAEIISVQETVSCEDHSTDGLAVSIADDTMEADLLGTYQVDNMNVAVTACRTLDEGDFDVSTEDIVDGLRSVKLEGRMECIAERPLVLFEGAHNPAGIQAAADTITDLKKGRTITVTSIMGGKDYEAMMQEIESFSDLIILSEAGIDRAANPEDLAACINATDYEVEPSIRRVLEKTLQMADDNDTIVFTGSLYFVGDVKQTLDEMWYR